MLNVIYDSFYLDFFCVNAVVCLKWCVGVESGYEELRDLMIIVQNEQCGKVQS